MVKPQKEQVNLAQQSLDTVKGASGKEQGEAANALYDNLMGSLEKEQRSNSQYKRMKHRSRIDVAFQGTRAHRQILSRYHRQEEEPPEFSPDQEFAKAYSGIGGSEERYKYLDEVLETLGGVPEFGKKTERLLASILGAYVERHEEHGELSWVEEGQIQTAILQQVVRGNWDNSAWKTLQEIGYDHSFSEKLVGVIEKAGNNRYLLNVLDDDDSPMSVKEKMLNKMVQVQDPVRISDAVRAVAENFGNNACEPLVDIVIGAGTKEQMKQTGYGLEEGGLRTRIERAESNLPPDVSKARERKKPTKKSRIEAIDLSKHQEIRVYELAIASLRERTGYVVTNEANRVLATEDSPVGTTYGPHNPDFMYKLNGKGYDNDQKITTYDCSFRFGKYSKGTKVVLCDGNDEHRTRTGLLNKDGTTFYKLREKSVSETATVRKCTVISPEQYEATLAKYAAERTELRELKAQCKEKQRVSEWGYIVHETIGE